MQALNAVGEDNVRPVGVSRVRNLRGNCVKVRLVLARCDLSGPGEQGAYLSNSYFEFKRIPSAGACNSHKQRELPDACAKLHRTTVHPREGETLGCEHMRKSHTEILSAYIL